MVPHPHQGYKSGDMNLPETENSTHKVHEQSWQLEMRATKGSNVEVAQVTLRVISGLIPARVLTRFVGSVIPSIVVR